MFRKAVAMVLAGLMLMAPAVYGASGNSVSKTLSVKDDYQFTPTKAFVYLRVEESSANEFGNEDVFFTLDLGNAQWFEDGEPAGDVADAAKIEDDTITSAGATIQVDRVTKRSLEVTINRGALPDTEKAYWRIPIYAEVTSAGPVTVEVDGMDGPVSSGTYTVANALGDGYYAAGTRFGVGNPQWINLREPEAGAFGTESVLRLVLANGKWFPASDTALGPAAMTRNAVVSGIGGASVSEIRRVDDKTLELVLSRSEISSRNAVGVWSVPLYLEVTSFGQVQVTTTLDGKAFGGATLSSSAAQAPVVHAKQLTLKIGSNTLAYQSGDDRRSLQLDVAPVNPNGNTLVPVRGIYETLGGTVNWDGNDRSVRIALGDQRIVLHIGSDAMTVDGKTVRLPEPVQILGGRTYLPLRAISENLGLRVWWVAQTQEIILIQD